MRKLTAIITALIILFVLILPVNAAGRVSVRLDGNVLTKDALLIDGTTYVPLRDFVRAIGGCSIVWDPVTSSAGVISNKLNLTVYSGRQYVIANNRCQYRDSASFIKDGTLYTPVALLVWAFDARLTWDGQTNTVNIKRGSGAVVNGDNYYSANDVYWLSRIINAESVGESIKGKIAVGNVVLNRVKNPAFPNDIYSVIFDTKNGVQFTPVANGTIYNTPTADSIIAAKICLEGYSVSGNVIYFVNPAISTSGWIQNNCLYCFTLGHHDFYA